MNIVPNRLAEAIPEYMATVKLRAAQLAEDVAYQTWLDATEKTSSTIKAAREHLSALEIDDVLYPHLAEENEA